VATLENDILLKIRDLIYHNSGIYFNENKFHLLETRLKKRLEKLEFQSFEQYYDFLQANKHSKEWKELFDIITINESFFFRAPEQLEVLQKYIIPEIIQNKKDNDATVRIWSAGCSTGEEPYSIAITIDEYLKSHYDKVKFQILASDINTTTLKKAKRGLYNNYAVKNLPIEILSKYFTISDNGYMINDNIKNMVRFANINLFDENQVKIAHNVDIIFCENVLIYFDIPSKEKTVALLYDILSPNGYLILGYSESLHGISKDFSLIHFPKVIVYKKT